MGEEYSRQELEQYAEELQNKLKDYESENNRYSSRPQLAHNQNAIVEWQLNLDKELELIHHQLRGHVIVRDKNGNESWEASPDPEQSLFNEKGSQEIEKIIRNYLNKNLLLSDFDEVQINQRLKEFAHRLRRFIYLNYEEFGLITYYKQKHFEMIVMNVVDMVEASYMRAKNGGERQSLTTIRQIIQSENIDNKAGMQSYGNMGEKKAGFFGRMFGR